MKDEHTLVKYIARQSLISAASKPTRNLDLSGLGNKFKDRVVRDDLGSALYPALRDYGPEADLVLMDMLSERMGALRIYGGTYATRSVELVQSGILEQHEKRAAFTGFGGQAHWDLWEPAAELFLHKVKSLGIFDKILLVDAPWTDVTAEGGSVPKYSGWSAAEANTMYTPYYDFMRDAGVQVVRFPDELVVSTDDHKWGASPYHYTDATYEWLGARIEERLSRDSI